MAIDLPGLAKTYYKGYRRALPLNDNRKSIKRVGFPYEEWPQDLKDEYAYNPKMARKLLADAGHPDGFKTNIVANTSADMQLLQIVKSYFADIEIDMEIRPMESTDFVDFVLTNRKHDQLAYNAVSPYGHAMSQSGSLTVFTRDIHPTT